MANVETVQIPLTVRMTKAAYDKLLALIPGDDPEGQKIGGVVDGLLSDLGDGGMMLSPSDVERIRTAVPEAGPDEIISACEESAGMEDGQVVIKWSMDNTMFEPLQQVADQQGVTVQECAQNMMDYAVSNGWFYEILLTSKALWFDPAQYASLKKLTGMEDLTGEQLVTLLEQAIVNPEEPAAENLYDLFSGEKTSLELVKS
jgi:hypothetical protein